MLDILRLYRNNGVQYRESGHKHCRPGWVQTRCPFCRGHEGFHLGFCTNQSDTFANRFVCWRCGGHGIIKTLSELLHVNRDEAARIAKEYSEGGVLRTRPRYRRLPRPSLLKTVKWPADTRDLLDVPMACKYLRSRNFNPEELVSTWGIRATGPVGDYKLRIMVPITFQGTRVSYQGRDYSGKSTMKYKACKKELETILHQDLIYGLDQALEEGLKSIVLAEGVTDVWRLGIGAGGCYGIKYRPAQVRLLAKHFDRVFTLFDPGEPQAMEQARLISTDLAQRGVEVWEIDPETNCDPGDMSQKDADKLMSKLLK